MKGVEREYDSVWGNKEWDRRIGCEKKRNYIRHGWLFLRWNMNRNKDKNPWLLYCTLGVPSREMVYEIYEYIWSDECKSNFKR